MNNNVTNTNLLQLTQDQSKAISAIKDFCTYSSNKYFRLTGYAGTGKTFVICQLIKWLQSHQYKVCVASPTNKAVKNLKDMARENEIEFLMITTVAKLLGMQAVINEKTGKEEFIFQEDDGIGAFDFIIIDEFSMINEDNFEQLNATIQTCKTQVIFVGDSSQLPPVGENEPIVQNHYLITESANLKEVVRYDGKLAQVAEKIRTYPQYNQVIYPFVTTEDGSIVCSDRYRWLQKASELFDSPQFRRNYNYVRFLTWRNKTASQLNNYIRREIFKRSPHECIDSAGTLFPYLKGDRLIAKVPVFRPTTYFDSNGQERTGWKIIINASEECTVTRQGKLKQFDETYKYEHYLVPVVTDDGGSFDLRILSENGLKEQSKDLKALAKIKQWRTYYNLKKSFDDMPYAYAITTHKAQGSTIDYVFLDVDDMRKCPDLQKILYTALTRAKKQVFIPYY